MEFGYPGSNTHFENHGVSEESFWPSFTDIMMVIVMVFLLVTITVILNNWTLIGDLQNSVKAQKIATNLAEERMEENASLEDRLAAVEAKLISLNKDYETEKERLADSQAKLATIEKELANSQQQTSKLIVLSKKQNEALADSEKTQQALQQTIDESKSTIMSLEDKLETNETEFKKLAEDNVLKEQVFTKLEAKNNDLEEKVSQLQSDYEDVQKKYKDASSAVRMKVDALQAASASLQESEEEKQRILLSIAAKKEEKNKANEAKKSKKNQREVFESAILALQKKLEDGSKKVVALESALEASQEKTNNDEKFRSLQGKYDALDKKYQKLLRPARSSKGKFVVSVIYKSKAGKRTIRLKADPKGSYKTVSKEALHKALEKLKKKYETDLYLKVVIPDNSGLSYNEAWKFTTNLQSKYDYYRNTDRAGKRSNKKKKK